MGIQKLLAGGLLFRCTEAIETMESDWEGEVVHQGWLTKSPPLETKQRQIFSQSLIQPVSNKFIDTKCSKELHHNTKLTDRDIMLLITLIRVQGNYFLYLIYWLFRVRIHNILTQKREKIL